MSLAKGDIVSGTADYGAGAKNGAGAEDVAQRGERFLGYIPEEIRSTLTTRQIDAIRDAAQKHWRAHPVNIRLSLPLLFRRYYMTLVAGTEQRNRQRRHSERHLHPLRTIANVLFIGVSAAIIYSIVFGCLLLYSTVLEL